MFRSAGQFVYDVDGQRYAKLCIVVDIEDKTVHILDLDEEGTMTLTNAVHDGFITSVYEHLKNTLNSVKHSRDDYRYYLYHTDGVVTEFKNDGFCGVDKNNIIFPHAFTEIMTDRKKHWQRIETSRK